MNKNTEWKIYCHTNLITGQKYIGQTRQKPEQRWGKNGNGYKGQYFYHMIEKYGWDNFSHEILEVVCSQEEADDREKYYIKKFKTVEYGYNCSEGGLSDMCEIDFSGGNNPRALKIICNNIEYDTIRDFAKEYNLYAPSVGRWLNKTVNMPQEFIDLGLRYSGDETTVYIPPKNPVRKVICDNVVYENITECARVYGISRRNLSRYLNKKVKMPQFFIDKGLRYYGDEETTYDTTCTKIKKVIFNDVIYDSITDFSIKNNLNPVKVTNWLNSKEEIPLEFKKGGLSFYEEEVEITYKNITRKVICEGKTFDSVIKCAEFYNVKSRTVRSYLNKEHKVPKIWVDRGLRYAD